MRILAAGFAICLLSACNITPDWEDAPKIYACDADQVKAMQPQYSMCVKGYNAGYCYSTAIMNFCTRKKP